MVTDTVRNDRQWKRQTIENDRQYGVTDIR